MMEVEKSEDWENTEIGSLTSEQFRMILVEGIQQAVRTVFSNCTEKRQNELKASGNVKEIVIVQQNQEEEGKCWQDKSKQDVSQTIVKEEEEDNLLRRSQKGTASKVLERGKPKKTHKELEPMQGQGKKLIRYKGKCVAREGKHTGIRED
ncbi:UNVERIFIED_CONTAM: hypothetical protein K2H54_048199 [Gekko kuhli]